MTETEKKIAQFEKYIQKKDKKFMQLLAGLSEDHSEKDALPLFDTLSELEYIAIYFLKSYKQCITLFNTNTFIYSRSTSSENKEFVSSFNNHMEKVKKIHSANKKLKINVLKLVEDLEPST